MRLTEFILKDDSYSWPEFYNEFQGEMTKLGFQPRRIAEYSYMFIKESNKYKSPTQFIVMIRKREDEYFEYNIAVVINDEVTEADADVMPISKESIPSLIEIIKECM